MNIDLLSVLQYLERRYASRIMRVVGSVLSVTNAVCKHPDAYYISFLILYIVCE